MDQIAKTLTTMLPTVLLWGGASLIAISMLAVSINRRRQHLTQALKKHVADRLPDAGDAPAENDRSQ